MKRAELLFSAILVPVDYLMVIAAGLLAYRLRFWEIAALRPVVYELPFQEYLFYILGVGFVWVIVFVFSGLYTIRSTRKFLDEFVKIFLACSTGVLLIIIIIFFQRELFSSRFIILAGWVLTVIMVGLGRFIVRAIQHSSFKRGYGVRQIIIVGSGETANYLKKYFLETPKAGYRIVGYFDKINDEIMQNIDSLISEKNIDEIVLADPDVGRTDRQKILDLCIKYSKGFKYAADMLDAKITNFNIETIAGRPLIEIKRTPLDGWGRIIKRITDTLIALIGLILLLPFFALMAVIIKIDSVGSVFARLERVGEGSRHFRLYKFRSMVQNAHAMKRELLRYNERSDGPLFKIKNDPRVTKVGRFIRRASIDELPQLINVIKGEMSLVGPRPHEPEEVSQYQKEYRKLLAIKPGMTGLAQISGRSDLSFQEEARLDIYYIENWSPLLDLKILLRTPLVVLSTKSAS